MSCRTSALRGRRSLRDRYTPSVGAPVGRDRNLHADHREAQGEADTPTTKWSPHAQWARPAGRFLASLVGELRNNLDAGAGTDAGGSRVQHGGSVRERAD